MNETNFLPRTASSSSPTYSGVRQPDSDSGALLLNECLSPSVITKFIQAHFNVNFKRGDYQKSKCVHLALSTFFPQYVSLVKYNF